MDNRLLIIQPCRLHAVQLDENDSQAQREKPIRKSPMHLLLLPVIFCAAALHFYICLYFICAIATLVLHSQVDFFDSRSDRCKVGITFPLLLASIPIGLICANYLIWIVPFLRRYFVEEARSRSGEDYQAANQSLFNAVKWLNPPLLILPFLVAIFVN